MAHPIPSSAPRVVLSAQSHSPSMYVSMGSFMKSISFPWRLSQTISMCDCMMTVGLFSMPGVAGLRITTLPVSSTSVSRPSSSPTPFR